MYYDVRKCGSRIQKLRMKKGMTQEQLSIRLNASLSMISKVEQGTKGVSIDFLIVLSEFFEVSTDYLLFGYVVQQKSLSEDLEILHAEMDKLEKQFCKTKDLSDWIFKNM